MIFEFLDQRFCGSLQEDALAHNLLLRYFAYG